MAAVVHVERERTETDSPKNAMASEISNTACTPTGSMRLLTEVHRLCGAPQ